MSGRIRALPACVAWRRPHASGRWASLWHPPAHRYGGMFGIDVAVIVWRIAWYMLARRWHVRPPVLKSALVATFVLIGAGFVGPFPLCFALLTAHE